MDPVVSPIKKNSFPQFTLVKASAGSGKTYTLTLRFVQLLLSPENSHRELSNLVALTFANNAAKEMKQRILGWLKNACLGNPDTLQTLHAATGLDEDKIKQRASIVLQNILDNYSDLQVKTIDTFMVSLFSASCLDLSYPPLFNIQLNKRELLIYALEQYLLQVREDTPEGQKMANTIDIMVQNMSGNTFPWNPVANLTERLIDLDRLQGKSKQSIVRAPGELDSGKYIARLKQLAEEIKALLDEGLAKVNGNIKLEKNLYVPLQNNNLHHFLSQNVHYKNPVNKAKSPSEEEAVTKLKWLFNEFAATVVQYRESYALYYFNPYLEIYWNNLVRQFDHVKIQEQVVFLDEVTRGLSSYVSREIVPDIYYRLGDQVYHYLLDEFQDTAPVQWAAMKPLFENALAQEGSLFCVGDTKQAIYGFRKADYTIMRALEDSETPQFPSLTGPEQYRIQELKYNRRSAVEILDFTQSIFKERLPLLDKEKNGELIYAGQLTGLTKDVQEPLNPDNHGYVSYEIISPHTENDEDIPQNGEELATNNKGESRLAEILQDLIKRGYQLKDITILAFQNKDVVRLSEWVNRQRYPFLPFSSLDIRRRKLTGEIIHLLRFLDSPLNDLAFTSFIDGLIMSRTLDENNSEINHQTIQKFLLEERLGFNQQNSGFIYKRFRERFPDIWQQYFDRLFSITGYYPLYDLVCEIYRIFHLQERFSGDDASLNKLLEVIMNFESTGRNDLGEFLAFSDEETNEDSDWNIDVPENINAIRIMTIHKAKGLESPVVILPIFESRPNMQEMGYLDERGEDFHLYHITKDLMNNSEKLETLYMTSHIKTWVDKLNALYVGLTRARNELYILGIQNSGKTRQFPFSVLPEESITLGAPPEVKQTPLPEPAKALSYQIKKVAFIPENSQTSLNYDNIQRGIRIHRLFYLIDSVSDTILNQLSDLKNRIEIETGTTFPAEDIQSIIKLLQHPEVKPHFSESIQNWREKAFTCQNGQTLRMDRVTVIGNTVTVIDFKSGSEEEHQEKYQKQMYQYMTILRDVFPDKTIKGLLLFIDACRVEAFE